MTAHDPHALGVELREQFLALARAGAQADPDEREAFRARLVRARDELEASGPVIQLDGLAMSWHPSPRFCALRMVAPERIEASLRPLFARIRASEAGELAAVFVDPEEFSYRNFENILPLDRYFEGLELDLALEQRTPLPVAPARGTSRELEAYRFTLTSAPELRRALQGLDELGLYVEPLNAASRGGRRFIFHSAALAEALTGAMHEALPKPWLRGFVHVNPVFRCNRFEPGEAKFSRHVDTPYYDAARRQVSRYTLLIYLREGRGSPEAPVLALDGGVRLDAVEAMDCVLFAQDKAHEGAPFVNGRKVFLRTELIFEDGELEHDPAIAKLFAQACYLSGESVYEPALARQMHTLYDRAAAAHWSGDAALPQPAPHVRKQVRGLRFVTNGYDYWFLAGSLDLRECAALAVLDLLNCKVGGTAFRKLCTRETLDAVPDPPDPAWLARQLHADDDATPPEPLFTRLALELLFPPCEEVDSEICCPFHMFEHWDASRNADIADLYARTQAWARRRIADAPITVMGQELFLDLDKIQIRGGKIHFLSDEALTPLNFAACWNDGSGAHNFIDVEVEVDAPQLLVPPIPYRSVDGVHHLMLDLFRNSWMVSYASREIPVPKIHHLTPEDWDEDFVERAPWFELATRATPEGAAPAEPSDGDEDEDEDPWYWEDSALMAELYAEE
jgi:hypothetical protein